MFDCVMKFSGNNVWCIEGPKYLEMKDLVVVRSISSSLDEDDDSIESEESS